MAGNELMGVAGVFGLTFCLIALYHFIGLLGRHRKSYGAHTHIKPIIKPDPDRRPYGDPLTRSARDDSWLLWGSELDGGVGPRRPGSGG